MNKLSARILIIYFYISFILPLFSCLVWAEQDKDASVAIRLEKTWAPSSEYDNILVDRVISGNILRLRNGQILQLIGVYTPEVQKTNKMFVDVRATGIQMEVLMAMGSEAREFTKDLVAGKRVQIEFDKQPKGFYGVLQGYVYILNDEKTFVNAQIIKNGYSHLLDTSPNVRYKSLFDDLHKQAQEKSKGLWKKWQQ